MASNMIWRGSQVRSRFIEFFKLKKHLIVPSSSVIPPRTLGSYFVNAGMNQFVPIITGQEDAVKRLGVGGRRVANVQKCIRIGGSHNDLTDVGHDTLHHTFFEMLGNWSFGDYFKEDAIRYALELLTNVYSIDRNRLYITYFGGDEKLGLKPDLDAKEIWLSLGFPKERVLPFGMRANFWSMADTGPCGPCSEIHYDRVPNRPAAVAAPLVNSGDPDLLELWNLVFMQFDRQMSGELRPLRVPCVDTGAGLERLASVLQGVRSTYDGDLLRPVIGALECVAQCGRGYTGAVSARYSHSSPVSSGSAHGGAHLVEAEADSQAVRVDTAYRLVADHVRMAVVCIADGLVPGTGHLEPKLRYVMYRAFKQAYDVLQMKERDILRAVHTAITILGEQYPDIPNQSNKIVNIFEEAEEKFKQKLVESRASMKRFVAMRSSSSSSRATPSASASTAATISERELETVLRGGVYGGNVHADLLDDLLREFGLPELGPDRISAALKRMIEASSDEGAKRSESAPSKATEESVIPFQLVVDVEKDLKQRNIPSTDDSFKYNLNEPVRSKILAIFRLPDDARLPAQLVDRLPTPTSTSGSADAGGPRYALVLDRTNLYATAGGQAHDRGAIVIGPDPNPNQPLGFEFGVEHVLVRDGYVFHIGSLSPQSPPVPVPEVDICVGAACAPRVQRERRAALARAHTATHVLNAALARLLAHKSSAAASIKTKAQATKDGQKGDAGARVRVGAAGSAYAPNALRQRGSYVLPDLLHFDFTFPTKLTTEDLEQVEKNCNEIIARAHPVFRSEMALSLAKQHPAVRFLDDEFYPNLVNVLSIGSRVGADADSTASNKDLVSAELCCGTHVSNTAEIEAFAITNLRGGTSATALKQLSAVCGPSATQMLRQSAELGLHVENAERNLKLSTGLPAAQVALQFQELTHRLNVSRTSISRVTFERLRAKVERLRALTHDSVREAGRARNLKSRAALATLIRESIEAPTSEKFLFVDLEPELLKSLELRILKETIRVVREFEPKLPVCVLINEPAEADLKCLIYWANAPTRLAQWSSAAARALSSSVGSADARVQSVEKYLPPSASSSSGSGPRALLLLLPRDQPGAPPSVPAPGPNAELFLRVLRDTFPRTE